jgi:acid phosphatase (class A)
LIKLKELLALNEMKYSTDVKPKHQKKMDMQTSLIKNEMRIPQKPFPENSSKHTRNELHWLLNYNNGIINEKYVKDGDDVLKPFEEYCKENNLNFDKKYYEELLKESTKTILSLKYYYNRPRPQQLAEYYGLEEFKDLELSSMKTPSYPSGHSTQGHLMAEVLGKKYPKHYDNFKGLSDMISKSRIMARAHYPSDCEFGEEVAKHILGKIK